MTLRSCLLFVLAVTMLAQTPPYLNPDLAPEKRAADLVSRMTLEEKILQMQNNAPAIPRLGVIQYNWWSEALHGVARQGIATVFPQAIGLAATWDTDLIYRVADVISTEARAKYHEGLRTNSPRPSGLTFWSPNINIFRDPRWGRGQETFGEDPYLTSRIGVAFVKGMQGNDPKYFKVIATPKHYAVHSGPEPARHSFDARVSERDLVDTYLPAFRATIVEAKAYSIMCAYSAVNGLPACASPDLLQKRLREDWGFTGFVVSDCGAVADITTGHKFAPSLAEASAIAVKTGTDLTCGREYRTLVDAVKAGSITEVEINRSGRAAVRRAHPAGRIRSARARGLCPNSLLRERLRRAPQAGPGGRAQVHRPAEERRPDPAAETVRALDRGHRTWGRRRHRPAGQLQRHAVKSRNAASRPSPPVRGKGAGQ